MRGSKFRDAFYLKGIDFYGQGLPCGNDCFKGFSDNKMVATEVLRVNYNLRQSPNLRKQTAFD